MLSCKKCKLEIIKQVIFTFLILLTQILHIFPNSGNKPLFKRGEMTFQEEQLFSTNKNTPHHLAAQDILQKK